MKNESRGVAWVLPVVIIVLVGAVGVGAWVAFKSPTPSDTNTYQANQSGNDQIAQPTMPTTNTEARLEFPWSKYDVSVTATASSTPSKLIGQTVTLGGSGKTTTAIGKTLTLGGSSDTTAVYAFDKLTLGAKGKIDKLYVEAGTALEIAAGASVGQKIVLGHNDLVKQAEAAAGISSTTTNPPAPKPEPTPTPTPNPTPTPSASVDVFAGEWNGTYTSTLASGACKASGDVSLSINSSGTVTGYAIVNNVKFPGTGKVDSKGNLSGSWNYTGLNLTYSGKLNSDSNSGSGTYKDNVGCTGSFNVKR